MDDRILQYLNTQTPEYDYYNKLFIENLNKAYKVNHDNFQLPQLLNGKSISRIQQYANEYRWSYKIDGTRFLLLFCTEYLKPKHELYDGKSQKMVSSFALMSTTSYAPYVYPTTLYTAPEDEYLLSKQNKLVVACKDRLGNIVIFDLDNFDINLYFESSDVQHLQGILFDVEYLESKKYFFILDLIKTANTCDNFYQETHIFNRLSDLEKYTSLIIPFDKDLQYQESATNNNNAIFQKYTFVRKWWYDLRDMDQMLLTYGYDKKPMFFPIHNIDGIIILHHPQYIRTLWSNTQTSNNNLTTKPFHNDDDNTIYKWKSTFSIDFQMNIDMELCKISDFSNLVQQHNNDIDLANQFTQISHKYICIYKITFDINTPPNTTTSANFVSKHIPKSAEPREIRKKKFICITKNIGNNISESIYQTLFFIYEIPEFYLNHNDIFNQTSDLLANRIENSFNVNNINFDILKITTPINCSSIVVQENIFLKDNLNKFDFLLYETFKKHYECLETTCETLIPTDDILYHIIVTYDQLIAKNTCLSNEVSCIVECEHLFKTHINIGRKIALQTHNNNYIQKPTERVSEATCQMVLTKIRTDKKHANGFRTIQNHLSHTIFKSITDNYVSGILKYLSCCI